MATTELHVLLVHWIGDDNDCTSTFAGWSEDAAWEMFLAECRASHEGYPDEQAPYASRETFHAAFSEDDVYTRLDTFHLPA